MREITQQEIDNAPEWATHYYVDYDGSVSFNRGAGCSKPIPRKPRLLYAASDALCSLPAIPRKPFDIRSHTFSDEDVNYQGQSNENCLDLAVDDNSDDDCSYFCITKQDAIAIAKHFKLI